MIIRVPIPKSDSYFFYNKLAEDTAKNSLEILLDSRKRLPSENLYAIIGRPGEFKTELRKVAGLSDNGVLSLDSPTVHEHTQNTPIYLTIFNRVKVSVTFNGETYIDVFNDQGEAMFDIDYSSPYTEIFDRNNLGKEEDGQYTFAYTNGEYTTDRQDIHIGDSVQLNIEEEAIRGRDLVRAIKELETGNPEDSTIPDSLILMHINDTLSDLFRVTDIDKMYTINTNHYRVEKGINKIKLPEGMHNLLDVRINGCTIDQTTPMRAVQDCGFDCDEDKYYLCNNCEPEEVKEVDCDGNIKTYYKFEKFCTTETTKTVCHEGVQKDEATCSVPYYDCKCNKIINPIQKEEDDCVWFPPYKFYIDHSHLILYPTPRKRLRLSLTYNGEPPIVKENNLAIPFPRGTREGIILGTRYRYNIHKGDPESVNFGQSLLILYEQFKKQFADMIISRNQTRRPEQKKVVLGKRAEGYTVKTQWGHLSSSRRIRGI